MRELGEGERPMPSISGTAIGARSVPDVSGSLAIRETRSNIHCMSRLQTPSHQRTRSILRVAGPTLLVVGLVFMIVGAVDFFSAFGSFGTPKLFWCFFVGMPFLFLGSVLSMFGFMGAVSRFVAGEQIPVATDAISDLADGTQGAVKTVARSVMEGIKEGSAPKERQV